MPTNLEALKMALLIPLTFLAMPHAAYSQDKGEAQTVIVENDKRLTLKFSNKEDRQRCGFFVGKRSMNQEEPDLILAYKNRSNAYEMIGDKAKAKADRDKVVELEKQKTAP